MSSGYAQWWKRNILYHVPGLFIRCPAGNYHWRWDRICYCRSEEHQDGWEGWILDLKTGQAYASASWGPHPTRYQADR